MGAVHSTRRTWRPWRAYRAIVRARRAVLAGLRLGLTLHAGFTLSACSSTSQSGPRPPGPSSVAGPKELLPSDLDVVLWLDVGRAKQLWLREPERQLLLILREYGIYPTDGASSEVAFGLELLARADRIWLACRPHATGCHDPVVLVRGDFQRFPLRKLLPNTEPGLDLGGGWLRYDRKSVSSRSGLSRVYLAPPDRILLVSTTELDAVERALERGRGSRDHIPKESGLMSFLVRPSAIARVIEPRSKAAARFLHDARTLEFQLSPESNRLRLVVTIGFESKERAERAATAARLLWTVLTPHRDRTTPLEVVGETLVLRLDFRAPDAAQWEHSAPTSGIESPGQ